MNVGFRLSKTFPNFAFLYCGLCILSQPEGEEKIVQNGQTEPEAVYRYCER